VELSKAQVIARGHCSRYHSRKCTPKYKVCILFNEKKKKTLEHRLCGYFEQIVTPGYLVWVKAEKRRRKK